MLTNILSLLEEGSNGLFEVGGDTLDHDALLEDIDDVLDLLGEFLSIGRVGNSLKLSNGSLKILLSKSILNGLLELVVGVGSNDLGSLLDVVELLHDSREGSVGDQDSVGERLHVLLENIESLLDFLLEFLISRRSLSLIDSLEFSELRRLFELLEILGD